MKKKVSDLLGIKYPIIEGGMAWCSGWELATAISKKGCLGVIGAGSMRPDILIEHIDKCKEELNDLPFGVNVPLFNKYAKEFIDIIVDKGVKIVVTSGGNPSLYTSYLKSKGIIVIHVVASLKFALKSQEAGVDMVVAEGFEAGGHNGKDELTTMVLIPELARNLTIPVIAAGGIATGSGWVAAEALGAEGVQIGSLFALSQESSAHDNFKELCMHLDDTSTMLALKKISPTRLIKNEFYQKVAEMENEGASKDTLVQYVATGRNRKGTFEGDITEQVSIGQCVCLVDKIEPVSTIIDRLITEYQATIQSLK